jgi:hypothetical protein
MELILSAALLLAPSQPPPQSLPPAVVDTAKGKPRPGYSTPPGYYWDQYPDGRWQLLSRQGPHLPELLKAAATASTAPTCPCVPTCGCVSAPGGVGTCGSYLCPANGGQRTASPATQPPKSYRRVCTPNGCRLVPVN